MPSTTISPVSPTARCFRSSCANRSCSCEPGGASIALLLIDLDGFKGVNDLNGHAAGDEVLIATAQGLSDLAGPGDVVARLGGDEFAIIQSGGGPAGNGREPCAESRRPPVEADPVLDRTSRFPPRWELPSSPEIAFGDDMLLRQADLALYEAKRRGRNTWRLFEPAIDPSRLLA